jgi:hypothetical protein
MMDSMFSAPVEVFEAIGSQKTQLHRVFELGIEESSCSLIKSTFPCLSSLMMMESDNIQQLSIEVGLARQKMQQHSCIAYPDHHAWDSIVRNYLLDMETTFFTSSKKGYL